MTDGHGRTVDFKNVIIVMTSNVGSQWIQELAVSQRDEMEKRVTEALRAAFKPEFLNRIDDIIIFHNLTPKQIGDIVTIQIDKLDTRLAAQNIELVLSDGARKLIAEKGYDPAFGARPLKRVIQKNIENPLSMKILKGEIPENARISAEAEGDKIVFKML